MLKELQPHYLDLVVQAVEAAGSQPLLHRLDDRNGVIYATRGETDTRAEYAVLFKFNGDGVQLVVTFVDARPQVKVTHTYLDGIDGFFPLFAKALKANRLEHRPEVCGAAVPDHGQSTCTRLSGHQGEHRCSAADVDARRAA